MKRILNKIYYFISKMIMPMFYKKKYLLGRYFTQDNLQGYRWCWRCLLDQKVKGYNRHIPFPVHPTCVIGNIENIDFDVDNIDNFWKPGSYYQCWKGKISIGKGTWIAQNVGLITENHNINDLNEHDEPKNIIIGDNCWIGMNVVILPGVHLGNNTVVGAGAVVTKSFEEGNCVIAGNPAKIIKITHKV